MGAVYFWAAGNADHGQPGAPGRHDAYQGIF